MFSCMEFGAVVMQLHGLYTSGLITREEWMMERQRLSFAFHDKE
jgi:hypothetical protein